MRRFLNEKPVIGVSMGDPTGVGSEIIAKAASSGILEEGAHPVIIGSESHLQQGIRIAGASFNYKTADTIEEAVSMNGIVLLDTKNMDTGSVEMGKTDMECGRYTANNHRLCAEYCMKGFLEGFCFGPHNKNAMKQAGFSFDGAVDLIAGFFGYKGNIGEINVVDGIFSARVTSHIPIKDISAALTKEKIIAAIELGNDTVKRFGIDSPRIAVAGLNPHCGEGGTCGTEEIEIIEPAINMAVKKGLNVQGPFPADTLFNRVFKGDYDIAVTMYHDQGQIAVKVKDFENGAIVVAGVPYPVTSCAHGTAYGKAGKGFANPNAWINAYRIAVKMATQNRKKI